MIGVIQILIADVAVSAISPRYISESVIIGFVTGGGLSRRAGADRELSRHQGSRNGPPTRARPLLEHDFRKRPRQSLRARRRRWHYCSGPRPPMDRAALPAAADGDAARARRGGDRFQPFSAGPFRERRTRRSSRSWAPCPEACPPRTSRRSRNLPGCRRCGAARWRSPASACWRRSLSPNPSPRPTRQPLDYNRQCLAEGLANLAGGFFQCLPGSGSLTRFVPSTFRRAR